MTSHIPTPPANTDAEPAVATDAVRLARAYLATVAEPPAPALAAFVAQLGPEHAAARLRAAQQLPPDVEWETRQFCGQDRAGEHLARAASIGARLLVPEDPDWPTHLSDALTRAGRPELAPPLALWVHGHTPLAAVAGERGAALLGAAAATSYGMHVAQSFAYRLAELDHPVIADSAYGIGEAAMSGALAATCGLSAIAVLGHGIDQRHPAPLTRQLDTIAATGLLISEYAPATVPTKARRHARARLVASLAAGTVVVEAGLCCRSLTIAATARQLHRPVMAVPGPITSACSAASNELLREPGTLAVATAAHITDHLHAAHHHRRATR